MFGRYNDNKQNKLSLNLKEKQKKRMEKANKNEEKYEKKLSALSNFLICMY